MEQTLKMKFKLQTLEFEMEGREQIVREEFKDFKNFAQGLFTKLNNIIIPEVIETKTELLKLPNAENPEEVLPKDYPLLKDLVLLDYPKTEVEWMLVYAFYESLFGQKDFSRDSLFKKYKETGRYTVTRSKHYAENFKSLISKFYIKSKNDSEFILTAEGKEKAVEVVLGKSKANKVSRTKTRAKATDGENKESKSSNKKNPEVRISANLNLCPDNKQSLKAYASQFTIGSAEELYLVIVYYLKTVIEIEKITLDHIFTSLAELDKKLPTYFRQVMINFRNESQNKWLELDDLDSINYSIRGMNHMKFNIKKVNKE